MTDLSSRALLVTLTISQWSARKFSKEETQALAAKHGTPSEVARVNKTLLPFAGSLEAIHKYTNAVRWDFYNASLPWGQEAVRIIKADQYLDFTQEISTRMRKWRGLVMTFLAEYPQLKAGAPMLLNGLYREEDYPDPADLARKFNIDCTFMPVPSANDWRISLGDEELDSLRQQIEAKVMESQGIAMRAAWDKVFDVVQKAHERLADPKAVFRDSLVENAVKLCEVLPSLNLTDDPQLEDMRRRVEGALCKHNPDTLREDVSVRAAAADKLAEIMKSMEGMYGTA